MFSIINKFLYPRPNPPHYSIHTHPEHLIFIPGNETLPSIPCLYFQSSKLRTTPLIIWSHGNACDIGSMAELLAFLSQKLNINILIYEYPSYGLCSSQTVSKQTIDQHTQQAYHFVRNVIQCPPERIIFYGHSIGTGTSCKMVSSLIEKSIPVGGLILQSAYKSLQQLIQEKISMLGSFIRIDGWNNLETMKLISCPILFIHGQRDDLIPIQHSTSLYETCISKNKHFLEIDYADHNSIDRQIIFEHVQTFLNKYLYTNNSTNAKEEIKLDETYRMIPNELKQSSNDMHRLNSNKNVSSFLSTSSTRRNNHRSSSSWNGLIINGFYIEDDVDDTDEITAFYHVQSDDGHPFVVCRTNCCKVFQCHLTNLDGSLTIRVENFNWYPDNNKVFQINQQSKTIPNLVHYLKQLRKHFGLYEFNSNNSQHFIDHVIRYLQE